MRLVMTLLLALAAVPARAAWFEIAQSAEGAIFIDPGTMRWNGDLHTVWEIQNLKQRNKDGEHSRRVLKEYDCKDERGRSLTFSTHSEQMGSGETLHSQTTPTRWRQYSPGSVGYATLKIVCAQKSNSR